MQLVNSALSLAQLVVTLLLPGSLGEATENFKIWLRRRYARIRNWFRVMGCHHMVCGHSTVQLLPVTRIQESPPWTLLLPPMQIHARVSPGGAGPELTSPWKHCWQHPAPEVSLSWRRSQVWRLHSQKLICGNSCKSYISFMKLNRIEIFPISTMLTKVYMA